MAVAFRSQANSGTGTAANVTGTEPAGAAQDDILIACLYIESDTAVTAPSGWTNTFDGVAALNELEIGSSDYRQYLYWIRRGASAPALQWTFSSAFRGVSIAAYSGALTSGDPFSFCSLAERDNQSAATFPDISGTTDDANELLIWFGACFSNSSSGTQPTGFSERLDSAGLVWELADKAQAAAGGTGTVTGASYSGGSNDPASVVMVGLRPPAVGGAFNRIVPQLMMVGAGT